MSKNRKHPKALPYLFFSEMWERFGYYLMIGILTFYLKDEIDKGGFGMTEAEASDLYGTFIAFVFLTPFIGGLLADRVLGYRLSITIGGFMMGIGYMCLSIHSLSMLYLGMILIILGNGFFKPNISTLLGNLYNSEEFKIKKDAGYNIFYMGINIGAFVCNFFGAALYNLYGWGAAFLSAGVGMFLGIIIFWAGTKHFKHVDVIKPATEKDLPLFKIFGIILLPSVAFGLIGFFLPEPLVQSHTTDAFLFGCIPIIVFYLSIYFRSPSEEKKPIGAMLAIFSVVIMFWAIFKQNGTTLNTWTDRYTDREIPVNMVPMMGTLYLIDTIPYQKDSLILTDNQFRPILKNGEKQKIVGFPDYFKNLSQKEMPKEGENVYAFNASLFQSVNPFWVIAFTPLILAFFAFLRRKGKEPSTPTKMAFGLLICGLSCVVMVAATYTCGNGVVKSSFWWFISSYAVFTVGELLLSPMGLSMVSKLSPKRLTALMMGGWFLANSIGNKLSGVLSSFWDQYEFKANFFWVNTILLISASLLLFIMLKRLNKIFKEYA
ncbi:MAG: peptide MFS transporter [Bacteroidota bacterium]